MMKYYQQGDVLIKASKIPPGAEKQNRKVLVEGEVTGHRHEVFGFADLYALEEQLYLEVADKAEIRHPEHAPILLEPGEYVVEIVREYSHFDEETRRVLD